ncbi:MAG: hypothetical protein RMY64_26375 [Nostoc sp. DedQUE08]|uniref:hypothetical protein n=1 Tax=Nostoc sp. DedQUE08 TaxID=3075393 RepID=UPI002AD26642|nr:hypothetical protein [Nostoc sp. DedQUE08]MDZ8069098.1 hypothetical protein [Nostoc sp. DedQUE08]
MPKGQYAKRNRTSLFKQKLAFFFSYGSFGCLAMLSERAKPLRAIAVIIPLPSHISFILIGRIKTGMLPMVDNLHSFFQNFSGMILPLHFSSIALPLRQNQALNYKTTNN